MKKLLIVFVIVCTPSYWPANATSSIDELMHSYMIAKADTDRAGMSSQEIKKFPYTVQVASYLNEGDAISHVDELKSEKLADVRYYPTFVRGEVWYKVAVGKFTKRSQAKKLQSKLSQQYNEPFAVVVSLLDRPNVDESYDREPSATDNVAVDNSDNGTAVASAPTAAAASAPSEAAPAPQIKLIPLHKKLAHRFHQVIAMAKPADVKPAPVASTGEMKTAIKKDHYYALQVGAFPSKALADAHITKMGLTGVDVQQTTATVNGQLWHRVFVGRFSTKKLALAYQNTQGDVLKGAFVRRINLHQP